ncbi:MAG: hypothetical protein ACLQVN_07675 [Bryobacteraceae bacterium]
MRCKRLLLVALAGACAWSQAVPESPGPAVGARVPDFQLADQSGQIRNLHSLYGPKGLMLVFFRSADW